MSQTSPRLDLPYIQPSQAQKHVTHNEAIERLDMLTQLSVEAFGVNSPPDTPVSGATYAIGSSPSGDWSNHNLELAMYTGSGWLFISPVVGWQAWGIAEEEARVWDGVAWISASPSLDSLDMLGINAAADTTNRLSVSSDATLLNHAGAGHQLKINKSSPSATASLLFQSNWTGHAEMGLAGDTSFSVKVSPDGGSWFDAIKIDPVNETVGLAPDGTTVFQASSAAIQLDAPLTGSAIQSDSLDKTTGRIMPVGAFGLGGDALYLSDISVTDSSIVSGFYRIDGQTLGAPRNSGQQHLIHSRRSAGGGETQWVMIEDDGALYVRARSAGAWQSWQHIPTSAFLTGNMTGTDYSPVFERGQNLNGEYTRFADGTQVCWGQTSLSFIWERELYGSWTFPASFQGSVQAFSNIEFYSLLTTATPEVDAISTVTVEGIGTTKADFRLMRAAGQTGFVSGDSVTLTCLAFGRWN